MTEETFIRGIQLINSLLSNNQQIVGSSIDTYYLLLKDYPGEDYIQAIMNLLKKEDLKFGAPSPAVIIKYIDQLNKEDNKALEVFDYIKKDIILFGSKMPNYKKEIKEAIENIGGWNRLRSANDYEIKNLEKQFVEEYKSIKKEQQVLLGHKQTHMIEEKS